MNDKLIYDIGAHKAEDTRYYLGRGFKVVAIDADPNLVARNTQLFRDEVAAGLVTFLNYAISNKDNDTIILYLNEDSIRNSVIKEFGTRFGKAKEEIKVPTMKMATLMNTYGIPYYCKIDIEGMDAIAVKSMAGVPEIPKFMSVEAECKVPEELLNEDGIFDTLEALREAGYSRFKIVDQTTLNVLSNDRFYSRRDSLLYKVRRKLDKMTGQYTELFSNKERLKAAFKFDFPGDSSGPFGEELDGTWMDYETARRQYLFHRRDFYSRQVNSKFVFWVDWHATY